MGERPLRRLAAVVPLDVVGYALLVGLIRLDPAERAVAGVGGRTGGLVMGRLRVCSDSSASQSITHMQSPSGSTFEYRGRADAACPHQSDANSRDCSLTRVLDVKLSVMGLSGSLFSPQ